MTAATATAVPDPRRWQALALVCVAFFMTVLDVSIVNVALPSIGRSLHFSRDRAAVGHHGLRDHVRRLPAPRRPRRGPPRPQADVPDRACRSSRSPRSSAASPARRRAHRRARRAGRRRRDRLAADAVDHHDDVRGGPDRNKALGIWGAMGGGGAAAGVLFGGILTQYLGWEWIFFVNVPVGALVLARHRRRSSARAALPDVGRNFDVIGASAGDRRARAARLRDLEGARRRLGRRDDDRSAGRGGRAPRLLPRLGDARPAPADAALHLPHPHAGRREQRRLPARRRRSSRTSSC